MDREQDGSDRVTVVIAAYNAEDFKERAIRSVLQQTWQDFEIIVADDCSRDETRTVVQGYADADARIKLLALPSNGGPGVARNAAIDAATGKWIAILDADDIMLDDRLERLVAVARQSQADVVADNIYRFDETAFAIVGTGFEVSEVDRPFGLEETIRRDRPNQPFQFGLLKPMFRRSFLNAHRLRYRPAYRYGEDFLLLAEALAAGAKAQLIQTPHYVYVLRVSPTTGLWSTRSRTVPSGEQLIAASQLFRAEYEAVVSPRERLLLVHREMLIADYQHYRKLVTAIRERNAWGLVREVARPGVLRFAMESAVRRARKAIRKADASHPVVPERWIDLLRLASKGHATA